MRSLSVFLVLFFICFATVVEADDGDAKSNPGQSTAKRQGAGGKRMMTLDGAYHMPESTFMYGGSDTPEDMFNHGFIEGSYDPSMFSHSAMPVGPSMLDPYSMSNDPMMYSVSGMGPGMHAASSGIHNLPSGMPHDTFMYGGSYMPNDTYMYHGDFMGVYPDPSMYAQPCHCPCMHDHHSYEHYDSYEYHHDSYDYHNHHGKAYVRGVIEVGHFLPKISGEISKFRPVIHDIKLMISQWDSLSALEELMSSSEGISLVDILPRNTDYSIIGQKILIIMEKTQFERILQIAECFFQSDEMAMVSFHMMTYDGSSPVLEHLIKSFRKTELLQKFMDMFGEITWLRKAAIMMNKLPWMQALMSGVSRIFHIEDYMDELKHSALENEIGRFGGCSESSVFRRCANETFASLNAVQSFQSILTDNSLMASGIKDDDPAVLELMGCILTDTLCKEISVEDMAKHLLPHYEHLLDCFSSVSETCSLESESTQDYISCVQMSCEQ